jgi:aspartate/methionine/tyrosine aminotransferase
MGIIRAEIDALRDSPIIEVFREGFSCPDVIPMWAGEPDVATPKFICDATSRALAEGHTFYDENRGIPRLRTAIAAYHQHVHGVTIADDRIALTLSGMNAVMLTVQALIGAGDNALVVTPSWPNVMRAMQIAGATVREVPMHPTDAGWTLDLAALFAAADRRTRVIYLASPGNPTGWIMSRAEADAILAFARARNIAILSDEVYHRIVYDRPHALSFLEIMQPDDPVFVINSFSKSWAMTGWRLGWVVYPQGATAAFEKLIQFNTSGGLVFLQHGAIAALDSGEDFVKYFVARCRAGREVAATRLGRMQRLRVVPAAGSFYAMFEIAGVSDTMQFCKRAVREAGIGMAPGVAFGAGAERHVRICIAKGTELLETAMDRLERFVADYAER